MPRLMRIGFELMKRAEGWRAGGESIAFSILCRESAYMPGAELFVRLQFGVQPLGPSVGDTCKNPASRRDAGHPALENTGHDYRRFRGPRNFMPF